MRVCADCLGMRNIQMFDDFSGEDNELLGWDCRIVLLDDKPRSFPKYLCCKHR